jgi:hypothetical protein
MGIANDDSILDDIPCIVMNHLDHEIFHAILLKYVPKGKKLPKYLNTLNGYDTQAKKNEYILQAMKKAYIEFKSKFPNNTHDHYEDFFDQVSSKLRTKVNVSSPNVNIVIKDFTPQP